MRIVFAATGGPLALEPLRALAADHEIVAVLRPARGIRARLRHPRGDALTRWSRGAGVREIPVRRGDDPRAARALLTLKPDLVCIATFPWILASGLLQAARLGGLNLHPSLLPRHRGADPIFWTYYRNDARAGVTVHVAAPRADAGPVLAQAPVPLPRGYPARQLYLDAARAGAALYVDAVRALATGASRATPQDDSCATRAPRVLPGAAMVDFDAWDVERVWHFLAGMCPRFREPLRDAGGRAVSYTRVTGFERGRPAGAPGTVERGGDGWMLWTRDGTVHLSRS